jgi:hypothetical protein
MPISPSQPTKMGPVMITAIFRRIRATKGWVTPISFAISRLLLAGLRIDSNDRTPEWSPVGGGKRYIASTKRTPRRFCRYLARKAGAGREPLGRPDPGRPTRPGADHLAPRCRIAQSATLNQEMRAIVISPDTRNSQNSPIPKSLRIAHF